MVLHLLIDGAPVGPRAGLQLEFGVMGQTPTIFSGGEVAVADAAPPLAILEDGEREFLLSLQIAHIS